MIYFVLYCNGILLRVTERAFAKYLPLALDVLCPTHYWALVCVIQSSDLIAILSVLIKIRIIYQGPTAT